MPAGTLIRTKGLSELANKPASRLIEISRW